MSDNFQAVTNRLKDDTELRDRVMNASTNDERKQILEDAGLRMPTKEEVASARALAGVDGAGTPGTTGTPPTFWEHLL
jgi:hypothetical protein